MRIVWLAASPLLLVAACGARTPIDRSAPDAGAPEVAPADASIVDATSEPPVVDAVAEEPDACLGWQELQQDLARGQAVEAEADAGISGMAAYSGWAFRVNPTKNLTQFFRQIAVANGVCTTADTCTYDPIAGSDALHELVAPDGLSYIWGEAPDGSEILLARKDRNTGTYPLILAYNECTLELVPGDATAD